MFPLIRCWIRGIRSGMLLCSSHAYSRTRKHGPWSIIIISNTISTQKPVVVARLSLSSRRLTSRLFLKAMRLPRAKERSSSGPLSHAQRRQPLSAQRVQAPFRLCVSFHRCEAIRRRWFQPRRRPCQLVPVAGASLLIYSAALMATVES